MVERYSVGVTEGEAGPIGFGEDLTPLHAQPVKAGHPLVEFGEGFAGEGDVVQPGSSGGELPLGRLGKAVQTVATTYTVYVAC